MSRLVEAFSIALILILTSPASAIAPVMFPVEVLQEHQEPEPEPETVTFEATAYTWTGWRRGAQRSLLILRHRGETR